jgi:hypothetical protein
VDTFEAGQRQVIARLAARFAEAIRRGEADVIELCDELLPRRRPDLERGTGRLAGDHHPHLRHP